MGNTPLCDWSLRDPLVERLSDGRDKQDWNSSLEPLMKQSQPSESCVLYSVRYQLFCGVQLSIEIAPCPVMYELCIATNSGSTFAYSRCDMTSIVDLTLPTWVQQVRCFNYSFAMPQFGHVLGIDESHRDTLLFVPHHPKTCFETKILYIFGKLDVAISIPYHHMISSEIILRWSDDLSVFVVHLKSWCSGEMCLPRGMGRTRKSELIHFIDMAHKVKSICDGQKHPHMAKGIPCWLFDHRIAQCMTNVLLSCYGGQHLGLSDLAHWSTWKIQTWARSCQGIQGGDDTHHQF